MPVNDSYNEFELSALLADLAEAPEPDAANQPPGDRRRRKAAAVLVVIWGGTIALHFLTWGSWLIWGLTTLIGIHAMRLLLARPLPLPAPLADADLAHAPLVSILVAAKDEEAVIERLVRMLCRLDYPRDRYELWVVDDNSRDRTPKLLQQLAQQYPQLRIMRRGPGGTGGKSGALNQVLHRTKGDIIAVFDADAQVSPDLLRRVVPMFEAPDLGALQIRKVISNLSPNWWIRGQVAEMALDSYYQQQRVAIGGVGELRGNGQFVRRTALERCGGWNEGTITDDLDLTFRLHLDGWNVGFLPVPAVAEEGVTRAIALWHQRNRWAEGGYQRYLDYWRPLLRNRLGLRKSFDLTMFWLTQYAIPIALIPDCLTALVLQQPLLLTPMTGFTVPISFLWTVLGLRQFRRQQQALEAAEATHSPAIFQILRQAIQATLYLFHWLPVMASTTLRMSVRPKRLRWIKTMHQGHDDELVLDVDASQSS